MSVERVELPCESNDDLVWIIKREWTGEWQRTPNGWEKVFRVLRRTLVDRQTGEVRDDAWRDEEGRTRSYSAPGFTVAAIALMLAAAIFFATGRAMSASSWRWSSASAYSTSDSPGTEGCTGRPLRDDTRTFASLIVPCGARVQFCAGGRCVTARRTDSGPYVAGRSFDLALGTVRALGFGSAREFGVRTLRWRRV